MKTFIAALALLVASANAAVLEARATCNADNCARSVTGTANTKPPQSSRFQDCQSYFRTTVTPVTFTPTLFTASTTTITTTTVTVGGTTSTVTVLYTYPPELKRSALPMAGPLIPVEGGNLVRKTVTTPVTQTASNIPAYASPCSGAVRYSSACSCFGATSTTTFAATPTASTVTSFTTTEVVNTDTTTNVATAFTTVTACAPTNNFDYKYDLTQGMGADLASEQIGTSGISRYDCCSSCYGAGAPAECAGTVFDSSSNTCQRYRIVSPQNGNPPFDPTPTCPDGRANVANIPGTSVALAACGTTRPQ